ncbi:fimbrillin family protein [uncultured Alistipes sp.]|jgi:hypothetical protein|uniref:fimbrillin family protein n=1 Tax=Alistipes sp. TaxID=1872444 RepID=UPI00266C55DF|nr:fimbrillin family protein [uncultured Alistipes sp.]
MKNNSIYLILAVAAMSFASCDKNEQTNGGAAQDDRVAVQFTAGTLEVQPAAATRSETPWARPGNIGVYMVEEASLGVVDAAANRNYLWVASQRTFSPLSPDQTVYYPVNGSRVRFAAYYPYQALTDNCYKVDLTAQPSLNDQAAFELLWTGVTTAYDKTQPSVALNFDHQYAKISLSVKNGKGITKEELKQIVVTMTEMQLTADFNVLTGEITPTGDVGELTFNRWASDGSGQTALVLPTQADAQRVVNFTLGSDTFVWNIGEKEFDAGSEYSYTVTVNRTPLGIAASITDWETGEGGSGDAE